LGERRSLSSQERLMALVEKLVGKTVEGMSNKALAHELQTTEVNVSRDLQTLEAQGWAEKAGGKWRLSPKFGGFAGHIMKSFQTARLRLTEDEARYASEMQ